MLLCSVEQEASNAAFYQNRVAQDTVATCCVVVRCVPVPYLLFHADESRGCYDLCTVIPELIRRCRRQQTAQSDFQWNRTENRKATENP